MNADTNADIYISFPLIGTFTLYLDESIKESLAKQSSEQRALMLHNLERQVTAFLALECSGILAPYTGISEEIGSFLAKCARKSRQRLAVCDF